MTWLLASTICVCVSLVVAVGACGVTTSVHCTVSDEDHGDVTVMDVYGIGKRSTKQHDKNKVV